MDENITISVKRYNELVEAEAFLNRLFAAGVDNWEGYDEAQDSEDEESYEDIYGDE